MVSMPMHSPRNVATILYHFGSFSETLAFFVVLTQAFYIYIYIYLAGNIYNDCATTNTPHTYALCCIPYVLDYSTDCR